MKTAYIIAFLAVLAIPSLARAQEAGGAPTFALPLDCTPGTDCWVMNYLDMGADGDGKAIDPFCGPRTYDGNKGTVFALPDTQSIARNVAVRAARAGKVVRVRGEEPDHLAPTQAQLTEIKDAKKECGNAVLIDHGNAIQTLYCHLKKDSITVKAGDEVKEGDSIGAVGMSGYTTFPQLHFGIVWEGAVMDPFTGLSATDQCGTVKRSLWKDGLALSYQPAALYAAGFTTEVPNLLMIDAGKGAMPGPVPATSPVLAFWMTAFGTQDGDKIVMEITAPDGTPFSRRTIAQTGNPTRQLYYTGRKLDGSLLMPGTYTGTATLTRTAKDGTARDWRTTGTITVQGE